MNQKTGHWNKTIDEGKEYTSSRCVFGLITEREDDLAIVHIDEQVVVEYVPKEEYRYIVLKDQEAVPKVIESFRNAAARLGFQPAVEAYIGEVQRGRNTHDDAAGGGAPAGQPRDFEELADAGPGPAVHASRPGDKVPAGGRGSVGAGERFEDLIGEGEDIFS